MSDPEDVELTVELRSGDGPISGSVRHASGAVESFTGWMELSTALERAREPGCPERPADCAG